MDRYWRSASLQILRTSPRVFPPLPLRRRIADFIIRNTSGSGSNVVMLRGVFALLMLTMRGAEVVIQLYSSGNRFSLRCNTNCILVGSVSAKHSKKKSVSRTGSRKSRVFSFQADPDVERLLSSLDGIERGEKTRQINEALRRFLADAERMVLEQEIAERKARLATLGAKRG